MSSTPLRMLGAIITVINGAMAPPTLERIGSRDGLKRLTARKNNTIEGA